jgi:hypothetical protein
LFGEHTEAVCREIVQLSPERFAELTAAGLFD